MDSTFRVTFFLVFWLVTLSSGKEHRLKCWEEKISSFNPDEDEEAGPEECESYEDVCFSMKMTRKVSHR